LLAAFVGKFVGAGLAARWVGLTRQEAAAVGAGMSARGAVELVIADIALEAGLFEVAPGTAPVVEHIFSAVVIMAVLTTLVTPVLLKRIYSGMPP
jgi:Kef-type K+ transport system membrane component KefB